MADERSGIRSRLLGAIVSPAVDAVDVDEVVERIDVENVVERIDVDGVVDRIDIDGVVARIDLNAALDRIDFNALLGAIDLDPILRRIDLDALLANADIDALIQRVDVNALATQIDVDALLAEVDVNALATRLDLDALLAEVDVNALTERIDVAALVERVDVNALAGQLDLDALLARIDINALLAKVDVDALATRIDINAIVSRVDVNTVVDTIDIEAVVARAGIDKIVADASTGMASRTLDLVRRQLVGVDLIVFGLIDRLLRRGRQALPSGSFSASRQPAGPVSRVLAFLADSVIVSGLFGVVASLVIGAVNLFFGKNLSSQNDGSWLWLAALGAWWFVYLWTSIAITGRTPGKALLGLRVVALDGSPLNARRTTVRTLAFPLSFVLGIGFVIGLVRRDRRSLHELIAGSDEIIDWGDRDARMPSALERFVERHNAGGPEPTPAQWAKPGAQQ